MSPEDKATVAAALRILAKDDAALFAVHKAIEDELVEMRDSGMSMPLFANGLVIKTEEGNPSPVIRLGTRMAVGMVMTELAKHLET